MISVIWSDRCNVLSPSVLQTYILGCSKLVNPKMCMFLCFSWLTTVHNKCSFVFFSFAKVVCACRPNSVLHIFSINFMSAFWAAAWNAEVSILSLVKDCCISSAAAYISYSHSCIIPFIPETHLWRFNQHLWWWLLFFDILCLFNT